MPWSERRTLLGLGRRAGRLTAVRAEVGWSAAWPCMAAVALAVAEFGFQRFTVGQVGLAVVVAVVMAAAFTALWSRGARRRLRGALREPLAGVPRESHLGIAARTIVMLGGLAPAAAGLVSGSTRHGDVFTALLVGLVAGAAGAACYPLFIVLRAERQLGGRLLYQRPPLRENLWVDRRALSPHVVYLVDDPQPAPPKERGSSDPAAISQPSR